MRFGLKVTVATAMAVAVWSGAGSAGASAAEITPDKIQVSGADQKVYINVSNIRNEEIMFGMATDRTSSSKTIFKVSTWDVFETGTQNEIAVDLSKLSNIKDNFVAIKTDSMEVPIIVKIPAVKKYASATYNGIDYELEFKIGKDAKTAAGATSYEWRTPYSSWKTPSNAEKLASGVASNVFDEFKYQGATLYIRTPGDARGVVTKNTTYTSAVYYNSIDRTEKNVQVYNAGSFPGKEAKLNIAKQANGPSISAQYTAGTVKLPTSLQYRIVTIVNGVKTIPNNFENGKDTNAITIKSLLATATQGILEARTVAKPNTTTPYKGKPASKWTRVLLYNLNELQVKNKGTDVCSASVIDASENEVFDIKSTDDGKISISTKDSNTKDSYQIVVTDKNPDSNIDKKQIATLTKSKPVIIERKEGNSVYIRRTASSSTKTWLSDFIKIGTANTIK